MRNVRSLFWNGWHTFESKVNNTPFNWLHVHLQSNYQATYILVASLKTYLSLLQSFLVLMYKLATIYFYFSLLHLSIRPHACSVLIANKITGRPAAAYASSAGDREKSKTACGAWGSLSLPGARCCCAILANKAGRGRIIDRHTLLLSSCCRPVLCHACLHIPPLPTLIKMAAAT